MKNKSVVMISFGIMCTDESFIIIIQFNLFIVLFTTHILQSDYITAVHQRLFLKDSTVVFLKQKATSVALRDADVVIPDSRGGAPAPSA